MNAEQFQTGKWRRALLALLALAVIAAALAAIHGRPAWYDEYYTFYITRPGQPIGALWAGWLRDNHPPLFYFLSWATGWLGDTVPPRRLLNLGVALAAAAALWRIGRARPDLRPTLFAYAVALAAFPPMIERVAELRSNFLAYAAGAVATAALAAFARPNQALRRGEALFLGLAVAAALAVHLAATMIVGAIAAAFGLALLLHRDWLGARRLALIGVLAILPFAAAMAVQLGTISGNTRIFWIPGGFSAARWAIEIEIVASLMANVPLTVAGLAGLVLLGWKDLVARRLSGELTLVLTLGAGLALAIALLVAVHLQRPFVIGRYLVCLHPAIGLILATGVAALWARLATTPRHLIDLALLIGTLAALFAATQRTRALTGWDASAAEAARLVRACPGTVVHADTAWNAITLNLPPADNRAVVPFAYRFVAARHGLTLADPASRALSPSCPTLFWAEHVAGEHPTADQITQSLQDRRYPVRSGELRRIGDGWLFVAR